MTATRLSATRAKSNDDDGGAIVADVEVGFVMSDPHLALWWLRRVRWAIVASEAAFVALASAELLEPLPLGPIAVALGLIVVVDVVEATLLRRRPDLPRIVPLHVAFDLVALAFLVSSSPDAHGPMQVFFVVEPAVAATVLGPSAAMAVAASASVLLGAALVPGAIRGDAELPHLASHAALLAFATSTTTGFVARLAAALAQRTEALRRAEHLASLGTLAAGVAHELATPLGTIGVLADEAASPDATPEDRAQAQRALHDQLARCRDLLIRLKTGPGSLDGRTVDLGERVRAWVAEWSVAHGPVAVEVSTDGVVRGSEERWRGALWTLLDNARRAGGEVEVRVAAGPGHVEIAVEDRGCGVDREIAARAGEPFFSRWSGGRGLGLYSARTFARAVGGDLELAPRPGGGARATLRLPREGS
ncbi:MAG: HAMP domain-containing sensor histidine kinase [Myxococcota bacterium]